MKTPTKDQTILAALAHLLRRHRSIEADALLLEDIERLLAEANPKPKSSADLTGQPITEPTAIAVMEAHAAYQTAPTTANERARGDAHIAWAQAGYRLRIEERELLGEGVDA